MSNPPITNTISAFVQSQVPEFIRSNPNSNFVAFLQAYYEWMEQNSNTSGIVFNSKQLPSYWDIDLTSTQFVQHFINQFLPFFPNNPTLSEDKLIKLSREFYQKKGSANSIQFLFRVLYGKEVDIFYPKQQVLKASDGKWFQPQILRLQVDPVLTANGFNYQQLVGRQGLGSISNASCVIESAAVEVDPTIGAAVVELFVSNVNRQFVGEDKLNVIFGFAPNGAPLIFSEPIISSIDAIVIAPPGEGGLQYRGESSFYAGDPATIIGGLGTNPAATKAIGFVKDVTSGSITGIIVGDGRFYYRVGGNTLVQVINAPGDNTGGNASVDVLGIDAANSLFVNVQTDAIQYYQNTALNAASYNFPNFPGSNVNTMLSTAFSYANLQFGNITTMGVISGGNNFQAPPTFSLQVVYWTDYTTDLNSNGSNLFSYSLQPIDDLGWIAGVEIGFGGNGYSNVTDQIVSTSTIGYGATFSFQTAPTTNAITRVDVTARGNGYIQLPFQLAVVNSANNQNASAGHGAQLEAFGFGQGAQLTSSVDQIGAILSFYLTSRGFDYVTTPRVSLRNVDIAIVDPGSNLAFSGDSVVFQGANANSASFEAFVDFYNQTTHVIRLYDYQGSFSTGNLITTSGNVTIDTSSNVIQGTYFKYYGNGLANANAIFVPGLEQLPGFYLTTDGQLSADQFLQDSTIYHNYSYKIIVEQTLNQFKKTLMDLVHPAGMSLVVQSVVTSTNDMFAPTLNISVQVEPNVKGNINVATNSVKVVGNGTSFTANAVANDFIIFNTAETDRKIQVKQIVSIANDGNLTIDSNTTWIFDLGANITSGSNVITGPYLQGNVGINDFITINIAGNVVTDIVSNVTSLNTITTANTFGNTANGLMMAVYPPYVAANYAILQLPS